VDSPVRLCARWPRRAAFRRSGDGAYVETEDDRRLLDWVMSWGPLLFGHPTRRPVEALREAALRGHELRRGDRGEVELAARSSTRFAVGREGAARLLRDGGRDERAPARARVHERDRILKTAGGYHGHADALLATPARGSRPSGSPASPGVPTGAAQDTIVCSFNDVDGTAAAVAQWGEGLAAIVVEPVAGNMGVVPPAPGFLEALRGLCDASGALLVFDEVITGFRVGRGGAQERYGVRPDLTILGKIVGGGLPLAAFGGRADVMDRLAPSGEVYQAGTLSGNPLATAAGLSVLRRLRDPAVYERLEASSARLEQGLAPFGRVQRVGAMLTLFMGDGPVTRFEDAQACDTERYGELFRHLLARGVYVAPSQFEAWFVSTAHGDDEIDRTVEAIGDFG
jgi:glutamate-1-semialdehyde 2,1-aminomutase